MPDFEILTFAKPILSPSTTHQYTNFAFYDNLLKIHPIYVNGRLYVENLRRSARKGTLLHSPEGMGPTQYKRPYGDVPPAFICSKSASSSGI